MVMNQCVCDRVISYDPSESLGETLKEKFECYYFHLKNELGNFCFLELEVGSEIFRMSQASTTRCQCCSSDEEKDVFRMDIGGTYFVFHHDQCLKNGLSVIKDIG